MTQQPIASPLAGSKPPSTWATGFIIFAAVMMMLSGAFQALAGLVALFENEFYVTTSDYVLQLDTTTWGWIHLLLGLLVVIASFAVLGGRIWGRVIGVTLAALSALANFAFIPYYPVWSLVVITLDVFVIWALTVHGRDNVR
ncbi:hypothetical protein ACFT2C_12230 [Promicromonospora sp. NPDC057138]|uniref:DUF7144 family membrane protein n=1 Tax=Promicromonospora sp. NPDC057138 TaxID=3346031 RepID=UPI00363D701B